MNTLTVMPPLTQGSINQQISFDTIIGSRLKCTDLRYNSASAVFLVDESVLILFAATCHMGATVNGLYGIVILSQR
jgi:hypothetical protein